MKKKLCCFIVILCLLLPMTVDAASGDTIVYITRTGECYHRGNCSYLKSKIETTLQKAVDGGYRACSRCNPPKLDVSRAMPVSTPTPKPKPTATPRPTTTPTPKPTSTPNPTPELRSSDRIEWSLYENSNNANWDKLPNKPDLKYKKVSQSWEIGYLYGYEKGEYAGYSGGYNDGYDDGYECASYDADRKIGKNEGSKNEQPGTMSVTDKAEYNGILFVCASVSVIIIILLSAAFYKKGTHKGYQSGYSDAEKKHKEEHHRQRLL